MFTIGPPIRPSFGWNGDPCAGSPGMPVVARGGVSYGACGILWNDNGIAGAAPVIGIPDDNGIAEAAPVIGIPGSAGSGN